MNGQERPTAQCIRVDVSSEEPRASAAPASRHWHYREDPRWIDGVRIEPCLCGGRIVAFLGHDLTEIVAVHNATDQHQAWRAR